MNFITCVYEFHLFIRLNPMESPCGWVTPNFYTKSGGLTTFWTASITSQSLINFLPQIFLISQSSEQI